MRGSRGVKGGLPPFPFPEKSSLVKFPYKITENRFWSLSLPLANTIIPWIPLKNIVNQRMYMNHKRKQFHCIETRSIFIILRSQMQSILNIHITVNRFQTRTATPATGRPILAPLVKLPVGKPAWHGPMCTPSFPTTTTAETTLHSMVLLSQYVTCKLEPITWSHVESQNAVR